ncbi:ABC transporter substrate-binding protein [Devosia rhodophyticola]|uniref:ABC transporter substrate-binding protein n=1 Tax=Devosia rhodophyticola TaxID=3026423 RepID=A0ABY7YTX3_9HYPH|nr:ABC transporter substrate-binding protein [Devosia rhodophyticola]WDR04642.1 ABC transporter substrate-binding protein [Devosia rhodophyticola]
MKFTKIVTSAIVAVSVLTAMPTMAQDFKAGLVSADTLTIGTSGSAPPFSMTGPTGELEGFDIDVATAIADALGVEVKFEQLDFAGLLPGLASGQFDIIASGVTRTPERLASTDFFLLSPYIVNGVAVTRREDSADITGWETVCGKVMGSVRGGTFQKVAMENLPADCVTETREYPGATELFLDLANRRIDFAAHDFLGPNYLVKSGKLNGVVVIDDLLATITQSVAVSAKNKPLADEIDSLFVTWRNDGTLQGLAEKWFGASIDWSAAE